jgi:dihydrofolate reductase
MRVFLIAAVTADGFIGRSSGHNADWTGKVDKQLFVRLTKEAGVIVMGARTLATIGRALPGRRNIVYTSRPEGITVEGIETTSEPPAALIKRLEAEGHNAVAIIGGATIYDLFMRAGLVNEIYLTIVPILFGQGLSLFTGQLTTQLNRKELTQLEDGAVLVHYTIEKPKKDH